MRRPALVAAAAALLGAGLAAVPASAPDADAAAPSPWCASGRPAPCLERLWRDGVELTATDPTYSFLFLEDLGWSSPEGGFWWEFTKNGAVDMGAAETGHAFRALVNSGSMEPRTTFGYAEGVDVAFLPDTGSGHRVDLTVKPVSMIFSCRVDSAGTTTCPHTGLPEDTVQAMAYGTVDDARWWGPVAARDQLKGLELFTNVHSVSTPPDVRLAPDGTASMSVTLQNSHEYADGTLFQGFADYRVPHRMLRNVFGIPDPSTMTGASLVTTVSGTTAPVTIGQDGDAVSLDVDAITFSKRRVRVETGAITPTRPRKVSATYPDRGTARMAFTAASPRGAKVRGYTVQCRLPNGADRETVNAKRSPVRVTGLSAPRGHRCRVRARSAAGAGSWTRWVPVVRPG